MDPIRVGAQMTETPAPEQISADELAYHAHVLYEYRVAVAVRDSWGGHLARKYGLGPNDSIDASGVITRAAGGGE